MKAAIHTGVKKIEMKELEKPVPGKGECLVKIKACSICGSDTWWLKDASENEPVHGHESAGIIEACGEGAEKFKAGAKVVCYAILGCGKCFSCTDGTPTCCEQMRFYQGGFQEYVALPEELLFPMPDGFTFAEASLLSDATGVPLRGMRRIKTSPEDSISVWGLGPLGLLQIMFLKAAGVKNIIGVDPLESRLEKALELGCASVINPSTCDAIEEIKKRTEGRGADKAFIYARAPQATESAFKSTRPGADICTYAGLEGTYNLRENFERNLVWSFYFTPAEYEKNLKFIKDQRIKISEVISDVYPLDKINDAFTKRFEQQENSLKVVIVND
jgi:threonine dehydrogenase-like Zn-dependent dehydrogenase